LAPFRQEYPGHLWAEVMLIKDLNDGELTLQEISRVLEVIRPDQLHLN